VNPRPRYIDTAEPHLAKGIEDTTTWHIKSTSYGTVHGRASSYIVVVLSIIDAVYLVLSYD
jgi:hypothetical protein